MNETDDGLTRDPSDPRYQDHLRQRVVGYFGGQRPSREEFRSVLTTYLKNDRASAAGQPVEQQHLMSMNEASQQVARESPVQAALTSGFKTGADMILATGGALTLPSQYALKALTGREVSIPTVEDIIPGDTSDLRSMTAANAQQASEMGVKGALLQAPGQFLGAIAPMGIAGKGATLLGTGLRRGAAMLGTEAAQQVGQEGYAPQDASESARRLAAAGLGGLTSVAGQGAATKLASRLPGAGAGMRIAASAVTDATVGGGVNAALAPADATWDERTQQFVIGAATNLAGTALDAPGHFRDARAKVQQRPQVVDAPKRLPAPAAYDPDTQSKIDRLRTVMDSYPKTAETFPLRSDLQSRIDALTGQSHPTIVEEGPSKPRVAAGGTDVIDARGPQVGQFVRDPLPPELMSARLPSGPPRIESAPMTDMEVAEQSRMAQRSERSNRLPVTPETYPDIGEQTIQPGLPQERMGGDLYREQTASEFKPEAVDPLKPPSLPERFQQTLRGAKEGELTGMGLSDRLKDIKERFGIGREEARRMIVDEINRRREPVTIRDLEESVEPRRADQIRSEVNKAARSRGLDALRDNIRRRNLPDTERLLYEAHLDRDTSRMVGDSGPVQEAYSGLPIPKEIREPISDIATTSAKNLVRGYTDPVAARRSADAAYESAVDRITNHLANVPVVGRLFKGAAASRSTEMKAFRTFQEELSGNARLKVEEFGNTLARLSKDEQRALHFAAEKRTAAADPKIESARKTLETAVDDVASEYVTAKLLRPDVVARYQQPDVQGYVKRIPSAQAYKEAMKRGMMAGVREAGTTRDPQTPQERIYFDTQLQRRASSIEAEIASVQIGRKQITLEQAEQLGYRIGAGPLMATMRNATKNNVVLKTMRHVHENMPKYWREPPAKPAGAGENWKPTPPPGWRVAEGQGWGVLQGKLIKADVFGDLAHVANPRESGWWKLAETVNRAFKTAVVFGSPGFYVKTQMLLNSLTNSIVMPGESVIPSVVTAGNKYLNYLRTGEMTPAIRALIKLDQLADSRLIQEMTEGADRREVDVTDYRDVKGGRGYGKRLIENYREESRKRQDLAETRPIMDEATGGRGAYALAEHVQSFIDLLQGADALKAAGADTSSMPHGARAKLSVEGLMDAATMQDNLFKIALAEYLTERGGGGLGAGIARKIAEKVTGKTNLNRFTPDEAARIVRDFYDVRATPGALRVVANVPVVGQAFIRWPYIYARNLLAKGYGAANPIMGLLFTAPVAIVTAAYAKQTGKTDEEINEMRKAANASETSAPIALPGGRTAFMELADLDALRNVGKAFNPSAGVKPGPDSAAGRMFRGIVGNNPLGRYLYQLGGTSSFTGKKDPNANNVPPLPLPFFAGASKLVDRSMKRSDMEAQGKEPPETMGQEMLNFFTSLGLKLVPDRSSPRYYSNVEMWDKREAQQQAWEDGARTLEIPVEERSSPRMGRRPSRPQRQRR